MLHHRIEGDHGKKDRWQFQALPVFLEGMPRKKGHKEGEGHGKIGKKSKIQVKKIGDETMEDQQKIP